MMLRLSDALIAYFGAFNISGGSRLHKTSPLKRRCDVSHSSMIISLSLSAETTVDGRRRKSGTDI